MASTNDIILRLRLLGQAGTSAGLRTTVRDVAAVGAAAIGVGAVLFDIGREFDSAFDVIRVKTGATGQDFAGLQDDLRAIAREVPASLGDIGIAVSGINSRLELTGAPLRELAGQFLELSRLTKTDIATNVQTITRALGDWDVQAQDQTGTLDKFLRASQASGAGIDELARQVVQFGAPLRQVGFTLDEAIAMFAMFEEAGVNTQTMMPGLKFALKQFYADGRDPAMALKQTFAGIKDGSIDTAKALDIFGQRAGADMVEAIRQGRFELGELTKALQSGDTIKQASKDTRDFSEAWQLFENRVKLKLEPIATDVLDSLGVVVDHLDEVADAVKDVIGWWRKHEDALIAVRNGLAILAAGFVVLKIQAAIQALIYGLVTAFWALNAAMSANPIGVVVVALAGLAVGLTYLWQKSETFRDIVTGAFNAVKDVVLAVVKVIAGAVDVVLGVISTLLDGIGGALDLIGLGGWAKDAADGVNTARDAIKGLVSDIEGGGEKTVRLTVKERREVLKTGAKSWKDLKGLASGGTVAAAGLFRVGERGEEVVQLPAGARVHDHESSRRMLDGPGGGVGSVAGGDLARLVGEVRALADRPIVLQVDGRNIAYANAQQRAHEKAFS